MAEQYDRLPHYPVDEFVVRQWLDRIVRSGRWTPTLTNVANLDASTAHECSYALVGSMCIVSGWVDVDPTAAGATQLNISPPVSSRFSALNEAAGVAFCNAVAGQGAIIAADPTNDALQMAWTAVNTANQPMFFIAMYWVIP